MTARPQFIILPLLIWAFGSPAFAQAEVERIPFSGGEITIEETPDYEKVLSFDGTEIARDYFVFFDRIANVAGVDIAFASVGPGGNACAPGTMMLWKDEGGELKTARNDEDCNTPAPAVSDSQVLFVPYLLPGETAQVRAWSPEAGFRVAGAISYVPQPDTDWATFDAGAMTHPLDLFENAGVYASAQGLLGDDLTGVATGLGTAGAPELSAEGLVSARGCVPHACGVSDSFVVVDPKERALYFASQEEAGARFWPARGEWPQAATRLIPDDF